MEDDQEIEYEEEGFEDNAWIPLDPHNVTGVESTGKPFRKGTWNLKNV